MWDITNRRQRVRRSRVEDELPRRRITVALLIEVEHSQKRTAAEDIERLRIAYAPETPVILEEAQDGSRIVYAVIHIIMPRPGRNDQKERALAKTAAVLISA